MSVEGPNKPPLVDGDDLAESYAAEGEAEAEGEGGGDAWGARHSEVESRGEELKAGGEGEGEGGDEGDYSGAQRKLPSHAAGAGSP